MLCGYIVFDISLSKGTYFFNGLTHQVRGISIFFFPIMITFAHTRIAVSNKWVGFRYPISYPLFWI